MHPSLNIGIFAASTQLPNAKDEDTGPAPWPPGARILVNSENSGPQRISAFSTSGDALEGGLDGVPASYESGYGDSIAVSDKFIVIGAPFDYSSNGDGGAAFVYDNFGNLLFTLYSPYLGDSSQFGCSVATGKDHNGDDIVVVGARYTYIYGPGGSGSRTGAAYVFNSSGQHISTLIGSNTSSNSNFGYSVAVGHGIIAVGTLPLSASPGKVYLFSTDSFTEINVLEAPVPEGGDGFGKSLVIDSGRVVVGSPKARANGNYAVGAVYVFDLQGNNVAQIEPVGGESYWYAGDNIAMVNGTIIVAMEDAGNTGKVQIFDLTGQYVTSLVPSSITDYRNFGLSVSAGNDLIIVGSFENSNYSSTGCAFVFDTEGNELFNILPKSPFTGYDFGRRVAITKELSEVVPSPALLYGRLIVGGYKGAGLHKGAFYISNLAGDVLNTVTGSPSTFNDNFGLSVAVAKDIIVAGSPGLNSSNGEAHVFDIDGQFVTTLLPSNAGPGRFGETVATNNNRIIVGAPDDSVLGNNAGCAYLFSNDGTKLELFSGNDTSSGDRFSSSIAFHKNTILIGAKSATGTSNNTGAAYVFDILGRQKLKLFIGNTSVTGETSTGGAYDEYGHSVAVSDDLLAVGAPSRSNNIGSGAGEVRVYNHSGVQQFVLKPYSANSSFGSSIAIGSNRIVVGAKTESGTGTTYMFSLTGEFISLLEPPLRHLGDEYGASVAISNDIISVGAPNADIVPDSGTAPGGGHVFLFDINGNYISRTYPPVRQSNSRYGDSIAMTSVLEPAVPDELVIVSAPYTRNSSNQAAGAVYTVNASSNVVSKFVELDAESGQRFGSAIAAKYNIVAIGSSHEEFNGIKSGVVRLFDPNGSEIATLLPDDPISDQQFGSSIAIGKNKIIIGAENDVGRYGTRAGSAYIFDFSGKQLRKLEGADQYAKFGQTVAISNNRIIIGAPTEGMPGPIAGVGSVYFYTLTGDLVNRIFPDNVSESALPDTHFGTAIVSDGNNIYISGPGFNVDRGFVQIYTPNGELIDTIIADQNKSYSSFGSAIAINDDTLLVGANTYTASSYYNSAGAMFVFSKNGTTISQQSMETPNRKQSYYGSSIAIGQSHIYVGAPGDYYNAYNAGRAYSCDLDGNNSVINRVSIRPDSMSGAPQFGLALVANIPSGLIFGQSNRIYANDTTLSGQGIVHGVVPGSLVTITVTATNSQEVVGYTASDLDNTFVFSDIDISSLGSGQLTITYSTTDIYNNNLLDSEIVNPSLTDSSGRIFVGARLNEVGDYIGTVYMHSLDGSYLGKVSVAGQTSQSKLSHSGFAVSDDRVYIGDTDADGVTGTNSRQSGKVYVFDTDGNELYSLISSAPVQRSLFGSSISANDNLVAIGDPGMQYITYNGAVHVFDNNGNHLHRLVASNGANRDYFGQSVAVGSNCIVAGAPNKNNRDGAAYIFDYNGNELAQLIPASTGDRGEFGSSVASGEGRVVVSAPKGGQRGEVYIYDTSGSLLSTITENNIYVTPYQNIGFEPRTIGSTVAIGYNRIFIGDSTERDHKNFVRGVVHMLDLDGNYIRSIRSPEASAGNFSFGTAISVSNYQIIISDTNETDGKIYIFDLDGNLINSIAPEYPEEYLYFGQTIGATR